MEKKVSYGKFQYLGRLEMEEAEGKTGCVLLNLSSAATISRNMRLLRLKPLRMCLRIVVISRREVSDRKGPGFLVTAVCLLT